MAFKQKSTLCLEGFLRSKKNRKVLLDLMQACSKNFWVESLEGELLLGELHDSFLSIPIHVFSQPIGSLCGKEASKEIAACISHLAEQYLEKKLLAQETLGKYSEINGFYRLLSQNIENFDEEKIAKLSVKELSCLVHGNQYALMMLNHESGYLEVKACEGNVCDTTSLQMALDEGITGASYRKQEGLIVNDVPNDCRFSPQEGDQIQAMMCVPVKVMGDVVGVLRVSSGQQKQYTSQDFKLLKAISGQLSISLEKLYLHQKGQDQEKCKKMMQNYVSKDLRRSLLSSENGQLLPTDRRTISVLFADVRGFSSLCEKHDPQDLVNHLNTYFKHMGEVIFSCSGSLDKYMGDGIMAFFNALNHISDHSCRAIEAAIFMQEKLREIPDPWVREHFSIGIGINTGEVIMANIGTPEYYNYTAIGDEVNIAARLESRAKAGQILVTYAVYQKTKKYFDFKCVGSVALKGKEERVNIFEVIY